MTAQPPRRVRRRRWVMAGGAVVLALLVIWLGSLLSGGPSPRLATVEKEPILVAPVHAVELGRRTQESQWGLGLGPDSYAYVIVAFQVDLTPEQALAAWVGAYGERYDLRSSNDPVVTTVDGRAGGMVVNVYISDKVEAPGGGSDFATPSPGSTVVTVDVGGG